MPPKIGLFGGTFDPVHKGHLSIAHSYLDSDFVDKLWVLLTPYPPHKQLSQASYEIRLKMLNAAFEGVNRVSVSTIENSLPKPSYSVQTIRHLKQEHPDTEFFYCMGEDSLSKFHTWKYYREILEECELLVAKRPGVTHDEVEEVILDHSYFVEHTPLDISSSEIRGRVSAGESIEDLVPDKVLEIIEKEQLYS
ncbi:MAG TPA: nicotinate (nicotinamide) nucleotide adenylyltransferase [Gracilimonas sp.]|uniref:nicotinate (nicotinamide) nucleotide adenylyltransferase n=1 Tax=Gracilimonas sp. TaxID=1974203 RepID=UPI002D908FBF|nr:nicotinate (nicotinamide) nucleotide adenylyltransferase [Gracilimonas sp.]